MLLCFCAQRGFTGSYSHTRLYLCFYSYAVVSHIRQTHKHTSIQYIKVQYTKVCHSVTVNAVNRSTVVLYYRTTAKYIQRGVPRNRTRDLPLSRVERERESQPSAGARAREAATPPLRSCEAESWERRDGGAAVFPAACAPRCLPRRTQQLFLCVRVCAERCLLVFIASF